MIPGSIRPNPGGFAVSEDPTLGRLLAALAASRETVTGRVLGQAGDGVYLFTIRGRTLVAASDVPLAADQTVQVQASAGDDGTIRLRLVPDGATAPTSAADPVAARLASLGLADNGATRAALAAFADAGAPLDRERLARAAAAIAYAAETGEPPPDVVARAYATLARTGWPASPPAVALAVRAAEQRLPNLAATLQALAEPLAELSATSQQSQPVAQRTDRAAPQPPQPPPASTVPGAPAPPPVVLPRTTQSQPIARVVIPPPVNPNGGAVPPEVRIAAYPTAPNPSSPNPGSGDPPLTGRVHSPPTGPFASASNPGGGELPLAGRTLVQPPSNPGTGDLPLAGRVLAQPAPDARGVERSNPGGGELPLAGRTLVQPPSNPGGGVPPLAGRIAPPTVPSASTPGSGEPPLAGRTLVQPPSNPGGGEPPLAGRIAPPTVPGASTPGSGEPLAGRYVLQPASNSSVVAHANPGGGEPLLADRSPPSTANNLDPLRRLAAVLADLPDAATGGSPAVLRAFALAGLRAAAVLAEAAPGASPAPRPAVAITEPGEPSAQPATILASLAATTADPEPSGRGRAGGDQPIAQPVDLGPAVARAAREAAAETVFKPQHLSDYDVVVAVPMLAQGQPTPARLAVAARAVPGGGKAYWLRVDAALSNLGPVSVRLSGADHGPMAITIVASRRTGAGIVDGLDDLVRDLDDLGLAAGVRVVDGDAETWREGSP